MRKTSKILSGEFFKNRILVDEIGNCWNWAAYVQSSGHGQFRMGGNVYLAHREAWKFYNQSQIPTGLYVHHSCGNRKCINPDHLFLAEAVGNVTGFKKFHVVVKKKRARKLSDDDVRTIRATQHNREPLAVIAARYGVSTACVSNIRNGKRKQLVI